MGNPHRKKQAPKAAKDNNTKRAQRAAVVVPLFISLLLWGFELFIVAAAILQQGGIVALCRHLNYTSLLKIIYLFIGYFTPTLIATIIFMFIQQFYFQIPAGLERGRVILLSAVTAVFSGLYLMHIGTRGAWDLVGWGLFGWTFISIPVLWISLRRDVRRSGSRNNVFSGTGKSSAGCNNKKRHK